MGSAGDITTGEAWGKTRSYYTSNVAASTALASQQLIDLASTLHGIDGRSRVLDLGSDTGTLALEVARNHPSTEILTTDISAGMVESIASLKVPNISTKVLNALDVDTLGREAFSHIFSTFALQFIGEPDTVLSRAYSALKSGGVIGLGLWYQNVQPFEIWQKACRTIDPAYQIETEFPDSNAWVKPEQVRQYLEMAKFTDVRVTDIWFPFPYDGADAFVDFWDNGKNPSAWHVIEQWKGDRQQAMEAVRKIVREQYGSGRDIKLHAILAVGRKD